MSREHETDVGGTHTIKAQRILVTGGCGFIGSSFVRHVAADRLTRILNIDKLTYAGHPTTVASVADNPNYEFVRLDICDRARLRRVVEEFSPDWIVHFAAETHVDRSLDAPQRFLETNVLGTYSLLEAALEYWQGLEPMSQSGFRFLHVSTDEVFGTLRIAEDAPFTEHSPYAPNSPYAASKAAADHLVRAWGASYGLPVVVSNCSNNYGPFQFPDKLIPRMIIAAINGRELPIYGDGANIRNWLHVEDHVSALEHILAGGCPGETYLVGGSAERRNLDLVHMLCDILDEFLAQSPHRPHKQLIRFVADRPGHDLRYAVDSSRVRRTLGWEPRYTLEVGLRATVQWYIENCAWWQQLRPNYDGDRLGLDLRRNGR